MLHWPATVELTTPPPSAGTTPALAVPRKVSSSTAGLASLRAGAALFGQPTMPPTSIPELDPTAARPTFVVVPPQARRVVRAADLPLMVFDAELRHARAQAAAPALADLDLVDAVATFLEGWDAGTDPLDVLVHDLRAAHHARLAVTR
jgi:hypothetical protein